MKRVMLKTKMRESRSDKKERESLLPNMNKFEI